MIESRPCGCRTVLDGSGHVISVGTCPKCLPAGAITWLIENGRQLDLLVEPSDHPWVDPVVRAVTEMDSHEQDSSEILEEIRLLDPSF